MRAAIVEGGGDHPVILQSYVGHGAILNTSGLAKVSINNSIKDPPGATMIRMPPVTSLAYWKNMPPVQFGTGSAIASGNWSARLELCQWIRETLDKESIWDEARSTSLSRW
jgi:hypothetical protein